MAIIRNAANTLMKGRVGQTTFYISKGQQVARQSRNDSNYGETARRTVLQQNRRVLWANLVQFYKISARWMPKAFESRRAGQTDYNKFMATNVPSARIPLTKSEAEAGACIVDAFLVSQGSLPSVEVSQTTNSWKTNLMIGNLNIGAGTTIAQLTAALLANNANVREGMQLSFVMYQQSIDGMGTPRVNCRCYELTLDSASENLVRDHIPAIGSSSVDNAIGTSTDITEGGFAWILSELYNGSLKVSTQLLINNNSTLIAQYTTTQKLTQAAQSYGIDTEVILNPDTTVSQSQEPTSRYIQYISIGTSRYSSGNYIGAVSEVYNNTVNVVFSDLDGVSVVRAKLYHSGTFSYQATLGATTSETVSMTFPSVQEGSTGIINSIQCEMSDGTIIVINFSDDPASGDMG